MIDYILRNVFSIFGKDKIKLIIYYGNKLGNDIDVFVVLSGNVEYNCQFHDQLDITYVGDCQFHDQLDITYVGDCQLHEMIEYLDPLLTEPILTGATIYGDSESISQELTRTVSSEKAINYLRDKANLFIQWAEIHFRNGDLRKSCDCIRFSISFYCFAEYYKFNKKVIVFLSLLDQDVSEQRLLVEAEEMAEEERKLTIINVEHLLKKARKILTKI